MAQVTAWCPTRWRLPATVRSARRCQGHGASQVKLAREIDEPASEGAGKAMVSDPMTSSRDSAERRCQGHGVRHGEACEGD